MDLAQDAECVIAGGHSLWFKEFFKAFLDKDAAKRDVAARKKIVNCGIVGFTLTHVKHPKHGDVYRIDPESVDARLRRLRAVRVLSRETLRRTRRKRA